MGAVVVRDTSSALEILVAGGVVHTAFDRVGLRSTEWLSTVCGVELGKRWQPQVLWITKKKGHLGA